MLFSSKLIQRYVPGTVNAYEQIFRLVKFKLDRCINPVVDALLTKVELPRVDTLMHKSSPIPGSHCLATELGYSCASNDNFRMQTQRNCLSRGYHASFMQGYFRQSTLDDPKKTLRHNYTQHTSVYVEWFLEIDTKINISNPQQNQFIIY